METNEQDKGDLLTKQHVNVILDNFKDLTIDRQIEVLTKVRQAMVESQAEKLSRLKADWNRMTEQITDLEKQIEQIKTAQI